MRGLSLAYCFMSFGFFVFFFFFQAEDGIRDHCVTGVQTCALPICTRLCSVRVVLSLLVSIEDEI